MLPAKYAFKIMIKYIYSNIEHVIIIDYQWETPSHKIRWRRDTRYQPLASAYTWTHRHMNIIYTPHVNKNIDG